MDSSRLLSCPNRPYLLLRCRAHEVHVVPADSSNSPLSTARSLCFSMDMYAVSGQLNSTCYPIFSDTYSIKGSCLFDWECSFVDEDHIAVAYRDSRLGSEALIVFLYDISKRQFRTRTIFSDHVLIDSMRFLPQEMAAEAFYVKTFDTYTLKKDRLIIMLYPNRRGHRAVISYHLQWPEESSATTRWKPKFVSCVFVRLPADFRAQIFRDRYLGPISRLVSFIYEGVDNNHLHLCVFDGGHNGARYDRFFPVDLNGENVDLREPTWVYCDGDFWASAGTGTYFCDRTGRVYLRDWWNYVWRFLKKDEVNFTWMERRLHAPAEPNRWSMSAPPFAVSEQGGVYNLDDSKPRFCGYIMVNKQPPSLKLLATTRFFDSLGEKVGDEILCLSAKQIRDKGYPWDVAHLALK